MASRHVTLCSSSLLIRDTQIKTTMRLHLTSARMAILKKYTNNKCGEKGTLAHCFWKHKLCSHCGNQYRGAYNRIPYDPAIPLLGIYPDKTIIQKDLHTPMFTAALVRRAKTWKPPNCPMTDECLKQRQNTTQP